MNKPVVVAAMYRFVRLEDYQALRAPFHKILMENAVRGTLLLAREGINGTIAGSRDGIDAVIRWIRADERLAPIGPRSNSKARLLPWVLRILIPAIS
jgi:UPF0176 protein